MYTGADLIPVQRKRKSQKTLQWKKDCVEAFIKISEQGNSSRRELLKTFYDLYNGRILDEDYEYVTRPYGKERKNFPSKMRNYNIIKPIIDLLMGEKSKRPLQYTVTVQNGDAVSEKERQKQEAIYKNLQQQFLVKIAQSDPQMLQDLQGMEDIQLPKKIAEQFDNSYVDNRAIKGQNALTYMEYHLEIYDRLQKAWFHFLTAGEVYTERGVHANEPFYDVLNPLDVDYDLDPDLEMVEDGDWALIRRFSHISTIIDKYHRHLTDDQVLALENPDHADADNFLFFRDTREDQQLRRNRLIEVITVYWKSRARIGFVTAVDPETGMLEEFQVEDGWKMHEELKESAVVEWVWVDEVWKGTRIDGQYYVDMGPVENQRRSMDNPSVCKLPINGRRYSDINSANISLVGMGLAYQLNYNIFKYRLELAVAKSKDIIAQFDINLIPKKWDMDKFMYFVEGTGIAWVDYNKEGINLNPQHQTVMDLSIKTIEQYVVLLQSVLQEWEKISGVNPQRQGGIGPYEGKATSQQAIVQSSHITEDLFRKFARLEQRDLQALVDYSKEAWRDGKKGAFVMPDGTQEFLDLDGEYAETEYGIFVSDAGKDLRRLEKIQELAQAMIQNGTKASMVAEIFESENFTQIKAKMVQAEKTAQELAEAQSKAEQQQFQQIQEMEAKKLEQEEISKERDRMTQIEIALINAEAKQDDGTKSLIDLEKINSDRELKERELDIREAQLNQKSVDDSTKNRLTQEKNENDRQRNAQSNTRPS